MDASLPALPVFVLLLLGFTHATQAFDQLDYCGPPKICPHFNRTSTNQGVNYEERDYEESNWICRKMTAGTMSAAKDAHFWLQQFTSGKDLTDNAWPVLLFVEGEEFSLCWMLTTEDTDINVDPATKMTIQPFTTFYVRSFDERQSIDDGKQNAQKLRDDLESDGQSVEPNIFYGAGYCSPWCLDQRNEIWIPKAEN